MTAYVGFLFRCYSTPKISLDGIIAELSMRPRWHGLAFCHVPFLFFELAIFAASRRQDPLNVLALIRTDVLTFIRDVASASDCLPGTYQVPL
jgi:hypothetical protein